MYSEWASLSSQIQNGSEDRLSVLDKFPLGAGKEVAVQVVKQLASNLTITSASNLGNSVTEPSNLHTDREVQWTMEVKITLSQIFSSVHYVEKFFNS